MAQRKAEKVTLAQVLKLVNQLSAEEQAKLRHALLQDQEDIRVALERLTRIDRRWTLDELEKELDLAG